MTIRFQGTFEFNTHNLKKHGDWAAVQNLGQYVEYPVPPNTARIKIMPQATIECQPDKDAEVSSFLIQRGVAFSYTPTVQIKKQMH